MVSKITLKRILILDGSKVERGEYGPVLIPFPCSADNHSLTNDQQNYLPLNCCLAACGSDVLNVLEKSLSTDS